MSNNIERLYERLIRRRVQSVHDAGNNDELKKERTKQLKDTCKNAESVGFTPEQIDRIIMHELNKLDCEALGLEVPDPLC